MSKLSFLATFLSRIQPDRVKRPFGEFAPRRRWIAAGLLGFVAIVCSVANTQAEDRSLHNIPKGEQPRFKVSDRVWPSEPGEADVCLWKDDKLGVVTITIDDNQAGQIEWWKELGEKYGYRFTWFIITDWVENKGVLGGTWEQFNDLVADGHDVQSHTASHLGDQSLTIDDEYRQSQTRIQENISDHAVMALAYPGGGQSSRNDPVVASKYYVGARGGAAIINPANSVDYMSVNSVSGQFVFDKPKHWADMGHMLVQAPKNRLFRGWYCAHYHNIKDKDKDAITQGMDYIKSHDSDFWVGLFNEVAKYGQERETSEVRTEKVEADRITLALTDQMDDAVFNLPLTVKVRLPEGWTEVEAQQADRPIPASTINHKGANYAMVQAVPDSGSIVLARKK